jgi:hypothetical protein
MVPPVAISLIKGIVLPTEAAASRTKGENGSLAAQM